MINLGYALSVQEAEEMKKFKESAAYGTYLKSISSSPAFQLIMKEHITNVDVTEDIKSLKSQGKIPDAVNAKTISDLFRQALSKMAICLVADSVLLKEIEDVKMQDVFQDLTKEVEVNYLLGKADKKYYEQAAKLLEDNKLETGSVGYRGLVTYLKQNGKEVNELKKTAVVAKTKPVAKKKELPKQEPKSSSFDQDITL
jgi:hypothetical protein